MRFSVMKMNIMEFDDNILLNIIDKLGNNKMNFYITCKRLNNFKYQQVTCIYAKASELRQKQIEKFKNIELFVFTTEELQYTSRGQNRGSRLANANFGMTRMLCNFLVDCITEIYHNGNCYPRRTIIDVSKFERLKGIVEHVQSYVWVHGAEKFPNHFHQRYGFTELHGGLAYEN